MNMLNGCLLQTHMTFLCRICNKHIDDNDHAIQYDIWNFWVYIKCNNLNYIDYKYLHVKNDPWCYITCSNWIFSSNCLNNKKFGSLLISQDGQTNNFIFDNLIDHTSTSWLKYLQDVWVRIYFYRSYQSSKNNIIIDSIYRHRSMDHDDFNQSFLNKFLEKVSKEQKSVFFWSEFNVNLLNYNGHTIPLLMNF